MQRLRNALSNIWYTINPKEPGPAYLITFFLSAVVLFAIALAIGRM